MSNLLTGKEVAAAITEEISKRCKKMTEKGKTPTLAIVRVGENPSDMAYERGAVKRAEKVGVQIQKHTMKESAATADVVEVVQKLNCDDNVDGVLIFRPLPSHIDDETVRNALAEEKDIDGIGDKAMAGVYAGKPIGYPPCTAEACMQIIKYYGVEVLGKKAAVIGRSLVIGRPVAMMLMKENATVTICHTKTVKIHEIAKEADIIIAAAGKAKAVTEDFIKDGQTIVDVGINVDDDGNMTGDVDFEAAEKKAVKITPVPGGVGAVTTSILMKHVIEAAEKKIK